MDVDLICRVALGFVFVSGLTRVLYGFAYHRAGAAGEPRRSSEPSRE